MATYEYLCGRCGPFDVKSTVGEAPAVYDCPVCARAARRLYSAPGLSLTSSASAALREREERSREAPAVVSEVPPRTGPESGPKRPPHPPLPRP
ncbi:zinc ribbon domain-containing protein [Streptomyces sp. SID2888]|nr:zinc ribbon domain-containing protein [Streptomyces sp. SID2888]